MLDDAESDDDTPTGQSAGITPAQQASAEDDDGKKLQFLKSFKIYLKKPSLDPFSNSTKFKSIR